MIHNVSQFQLWAGMYVCMYAHVQVYLYLIPGLYTIVFGYKLMALIISIFGKDQKGVLLYVCMYCYM